MIPSSPPDRLFALLRVTVFTCLLIPISVQAQAGSPAGAVPVSRLEARRNALLGRLGNGIAMVSRPR